MNASSDAATAGSLPALSELLDLVPADAVAVVGERDSVDYGALSDAADYLAACLRCSGVEVGTRVGLMVSGAVEFAVALCALEQVGASVVVLGHAAMPNVVADRMSRGGVELVLAHVATEHVLDDVLHEVHVDEMPRIVAGDYSLAAVSEVVERRPIQEIVFFEDDPGRAAVTALMAGLSVGAVVTFEVLADRRGHVSVG